MYMLSGACSACGTSSIPSGHGGDSRHSSRRRQTLALTESRKRAPGKAGRPCHAASFAKALRPCSPLVPFELGRCWFSTLQAFEARAGVLINALTKLLHALAALTAPRTERGRRRGRAKNDPN